MNNLITAVHVGKPKGVREELARGADVNCVDRDKRTPLMHAVLNKNEAIVRLLLEAGANPALQDSYGFTALHYAAQEYLPDFIDLLIDAGAPVDAVDKHGNTPLSKAVFGSRGRGEVIHKLLAAGADKNRENNYGVSPASLAASIANYDIAKFLSN